MRLASSEGDTARLSGQMSIPYLRDKRGFCKVAGARRATAIRRAADCKLVPAAAAAAGKARSSRKLIRRRAASSQRTRRTQDKTLTQRETADLGEFRAMTKRQRQPVKRNSAAQMMHMMHADICSEPAQNDRKVVVRTAVQRGLVKVPRFIVRPKRVLELVLDIEQPDAERGADQHDRQMHQEEWTKADRPNRDSRDEAKWRGSLPSCSARAASRRASVRSAAAAAERKDRRGRDRTSPAGADTADSTADPSATATDIR